MKTPLIVLSTDFGLEDSFTCVLKGVIYNLARDAKIIDLSHNTERHNIKTAAFNLGTSVKYFPDDTIFLSVIDPGVGTDRKAIALRAENKYFIAPDNGTLSFVLRDCNVEEAVTITNKKYFLHDVSSTFHGRDIFAPVAGHLALGVDLKEFGPSINPKELITFPSPRAKLDSRNIWHGEVLHIDRFGNIITSFTGEILGINKPDSKVSRKSWMFEVNNKIINCVYHTFAEVNSGEFVSYVGSNGYMEIGIRDGNAARTLKADLDTLVTAKIH